jgi:hypothetical protein
VLRGPATRTGALLGPPTYQRQAEMWPFVVMAVVVVVFGSIDLADA